MKMKWTKWELRGRAPTLKHAEAEVKLLLSTATKKQARILKEGREYSIYIRKKVLTFRKGTRWKP